MSIRITSIKQLNALIAEMDRMGATTSARMQTLLDLFVKGPSLTQDIMGSEHRLVSLRSMEQKGTLSSKPVSPKSRKTGTKWSIRPEAMEVLKRTMAHEQSQSRTAHDVISNWLWLHDLALAITASQGWVSRPDGTEEEVLCCVDAKQLLEAPYTIENHLDFAIELCAEAAATCGIHPPILSVT